MRLYSQQVRRLKPTLGVQSREMAFARPYVDYSGFHYISGTDPLFTHQYSQAWFDFRGKHDRYADYFANSITATRAHEKFCLDRGKPYSEDYWGITASDSEAGYTAWGGPPALGKIDGSVVPCATAGSRSRISAVKNFIASASSFRLVDRRALPS